MNEAPKLDLYKTWTHSHVGSTNGVRFIDGPNEWVVPGEIFFAIRDTNLPQEFGTTELLLPAETVINFLAQLNGELSREMSKNWLKNS